MNPIKIFALSFFIITLSFVNSVFAQSNSSEAMKKVASVNITNTKIEKQTNNTFEVSFDLKNGDSVQGGIKYSISLASKSNDGYSVVDQEVYDDLVTLAENTTIHKSAVYVAPEGLSGSYTLFVNASNSQGFPFGIATLGEVSLVAVKNIIDISPNDCSLFIVGEDKVYKIDDGVIIDKEDSLKLSCTILNQSSAYLQAKVVAETMKGSVYGSVIESENKFNSISFGPKESKTVEILIPKNEVAGKYISSFYLDFGTGKSNKIMAPFVISGAQGSILNVSPDSSYYEKNSQAKINVLWSGSDVYSVSASILSPKGTICGENSIDGATFGSSDISVSINKSCKDPIIKVTLKDKTGSVLDETSTKIKSEMTSKSLNKTQILFILAFFIIVIIALLKKRKNRPLNSPVITVLVIGLSFLFFPSLKAQADTYEIYPGSGIFVTVNVDNQSNPGSSQYNPGDTIWVSGSIQNNSGLTQVMSLSAITIGNNSVNLFNSPSVVISGSGTNYAIGIARSFIATSSPGNYTIDFSAGVNRGNSIVWHINDVVGARLLIQDQASTTVLNKTSTSAAQNGTLNNLTGTYTITGSWNSGSGNIIKMRICSAWYEVQYNSLINEDNPASYVTIPLPASTAPYTVFITAGNTEPQQCN